MAHRPELVTSRIDLVPMTSDHLPLLHRLDSDPVVMQYLLGRARTPEEINDFWKPRCVDTAFDAVGLGWWVGFTRGDFLGWWDLTPIDAPSLPPAAPVDAEIGWRLERRHWRQGLASEGAGELLRYGFETVGLRRIRAETMAVNLASRGVMRKLGMRHTYTELREWENPIPGAEHGEVVYEITTEDWRRLTPTN